MCTLHIVLMCMCECVSLSRLCVTLIGSHKMNDNATVCLHKMKCIILLLNRLIRSFSVSLHSFRSTFRMLGALCSLRQFEHGTCTHSPITFNKCHRFFILSSIINDRYIMCACVSVCVLSLFPFLFPFRFFHPFQLCIVWMRQRASFFSS